TTKILCCENETLFSGLNISTYPPSIDRRKAKKIKFALDQAQESSADLIVVQQHLPTAAGLARRVSTPVIMHKHNMIKSVPVTGVLNALKRRWHVNQYKALAGIIFVSETCRDLFRADWPEVTIPMSVVYNGLDFSGWQPAHTRRSEIICVGRAAPEKGIKEAAQAVVDILSREPSWSARFILSEVQRFPDYFQDVMTTLHPVAERATVEVNQTFAVVRHRLEEAAIALVPSRWEEPFGRTALEAHAAGCAVVSSGTGGLREVSGKYALFLPDRFSAGDIADQVSVLIGNPGMMNRLAQEGRNYCSQKFALANISTSADFFYERIVRQCRMDAA
ncbi:MAG: glycosyltransferase family 4 protein, partial [Proteobacteria bacterium]|nr:glycosyltransferase family 4 protein [Pseudomonadota bacterium]